MLTTWSDQLASPPPRCTVTDSIVTSSTGLSWLPVFIRLIRSTTSAPSMTSPKMVCFPLSHGVGTTVMKNCEPLVPGQAFAIASRYGRSKTRSG